MKKKKKKNQMKIIVQPTSAGLCVADPILSHRPLTLLFRANPPPGLLPHPTLPVTLAPLTPLFPAPSRHALGTISPRGTVALFLKHFRQDFQGTVLFHQAALHPEPFLEVGGGTVNSGHPGGPLRVRCKGGAVSPQARLLLLVTSHTKGAPVLWPGVGASSRSGNGSLTALAGALGPFRPSTPAPIHGQVGGDC